MEAFGGQGAAHRPVLEGEDPSITLVLNDDILRTFDVEEVMGAIVKLAGVLAIEAFVATAGKGIVELRVMALEELGEVIAVKALQGQVFAV